MENMNSVIGTTIEVTETSDILVQIGIKETPN